jgi:hypothetical protein
LQKIHGTQKQRQTETPKFPIESRGHVICSSTELWAHKNMQKNAMEEKKIRRIQILAGRKQIKTHERIPKTEPTSK